MGAGPLIHRMLRPPAPWGDHGRILTHGMTAHRGRTGKGHLQLERTGPFIPAITFPGIGDVLVTEPLRQKLDASGLTGFSFQPVKLARIVHLDWHLWDQTAKEPQERPKGSEPENYILGRWRSWSLPKSMGAVWELVAERGAIEVRVPDPATVNDTRVGLASGSITGLDVFRGDKSSYLYVSERAQAWFAREAAGLVAFQSCAGGPGQSDTSI